MIYTKSSFLSFPLRYVVVETLKRNSGQRVDRQRREKRVACAVVKNRVPGYNVYRHCKDM